MESGIGTLARGVMDALFPKFCFRCKREGTYWCRACEEAFVPWRYEERCPFCKRGESNRTCEACAAETFLDGAFGACAYANPVVREAMGTWKYHSVKEAGEVIERWVRRACSAVAMLPEPFEVCALPLHKTRARARGFDQSQLIAQAVAQAFGKEPMDLLERVIATSAQAQTSASERTVGDLDGVFAVCAEVPPRVVLCDDVFTSGATMDAAAKVLKEHGAEEVWGFAVARS